MTDGDPVAHDSDFPVSDSLFNRPDLDDVLAALEEADAVQKQAVSSTLVYGLSDLSPTDWQRLEDTWMRLPAQTKHRVMRALNESSEALFELNYRELGLRSLGDKSPIVREAAIELLWTDDSEQAMGELIGLADRDPEPAVRSSAIKALGRFILLGEYGDVSEDLAQEAQQLALRLHNDESQSLELRRRALESLANSSHSRVHDLIAKAYADGNHDLKISAIFAMGRTCSSAWREILLDELEGDDNEAVYEAATACGQIQIEESVPRIGELALSDDREIQLAAIWALGEIGGKQAFEILSRLDDVLDDDETATVLAEALDTAGFRRTLAGLDLGLAED